MYVSKTLLHNDSKEWMIIMPPTEFESMLGAIFGKNVGAVRVRYE